MAIFKCKMCGGSLEVTEGASFCTCEFCGTRQTIPTVKDEEMQILYNRANVLRIKSEFDKAAQIYEKILQRDDREAEAYWGLILCKYGIEYVEDPKTYKRVPTCHRASYDAVISDEDYRNAIKYADSAQRGIYEAEAAAIDEIQKNIIALAQKEDPYDVFICYKETDDSGKRTPDSVIANDIYYQLTNEGFKVFYAAITLEDKLGAEYEPYIFSALNTAKVMLAIGTKPEYFNAVWVKNEWSRFLKIMKKDRSKMLIPCYRDMDPYELPEEFVHLQAQDMGKIGFINDIARGIKKVISKESAKPAAQETVVVQSGGSTSANAQIKRGNMALEDHDWAKADGFFEEALNLDPECAEAYIGKLLAKEKMPDLDCWINAQIAKYAEEKFEALEACPEDTEHINSMAKEMAVPTYLTEETIKRQYIFDREYNSSLFCRQRQKETQLNELSSERLLSRAKQYAKGETRKRLDDGLTSITEALDKRIDEARQNDNEAIERIKAAYAGHIAQADRKVQELHDDAANRRKQYYQDIVTRMRSASSVSDYEGIIKELNKLENYKDCSARVEQCRKKIELKTKQRKKLTAIAIAAAIACLAFVILLTQVIIPNNKYNAAVELMESGEYEQAITAFEALNGYKDSTDKITECSYGIAVDLKNAEKYEEAISAFKALGDYKDNAEQITTCETAIKDIKYNTAVKLMESGKYEEAITAFEALGGYKDSADKITECNYGIAVDLKNAEKYEEAIAAFKALGDYKDSAEQITTCETAIKDIKYNTAVKLMESGKYEEAISTFKASDGYKDSAEQIEKCRQLILANSEVGDYVYFGSYEQDNDTANGAEEIEWLVLDKQDNKILVISRYGLDTKPYNKERKDITWEKCTLRSWLNSDFYNAAFSADEKKAIVQTEVSADKNPVYSTNPGNDTTDKVFLLSINEANKYFSSASERQCTPTDYAIAQGAYTSSTYTVGGKAACWWWLRSPGFYRSIAAYVNFVGSVYHFGNNVGDDYDCVRPALWINLEA